MTNVSFFNVPASLSKKIYNMRSHRNMFDTINRFGKTNLWITNTSFDFSFFWNIIRKIKYDSKYSYRHFDSWILSMHGNSKIDNITIVQTNIQFIFSMFFFCSCIIYSLISIFLDLIFVFISSIQWKLEHLLNYIFKYKHWHEKNIFFRFIINFDLYGNSEKWGQQKQLTMKI